VEFDWNLLLNAAMLLILIGGGVYAAIRAGKSTAAQIWEQEAKAVRARADRLHDDLQQALAANREMQQQVSKLEALPDLTVLLREMAEQRESGEKRLTEAMRLIAEMFQSQENRAAEMSQRQEDRAVERHRLIIESFGQLNSGMTEINKSLRAMNGGGK
jgi:microcompartment protein CcmL/EutN